MITLKQIESDHGVSRSALHTYRRSSTFPQPVPVEGSTKTLYRADEVAAWFHANPKQQGRKRDQFVSRQQGETAMSVYAVTLRVEAESEVTPEQIRQEIYNAGENLPFGFDITGVEPSE
ncbi:helix-turn-helix transcriptional regulator [Streptomyces sp. NPDC056188]|uniref:helix-turn-helix transcriptional regulator n=1 Tax=Streptomyces sp. NPDC056188 TaxID=3345740 RepID=UPI0035DFE887